MPKYTVLATTHASHATDLCDIKLGVKTEFDFGCGANVFVTPFAGEDAYDVLRRAHKACRKLGIDPSDVCLEPATLDRANARGLI